MATPPNPSIPKKSALPKPKKQDPVRGVTNHAGNAKTVEKVIERIKDHYNHFKEQAVRKSFETDMKDADAMFRMAKSQTKQDDNKTRDTLDTVPDIFFRDLRTITTNESSILYGGTDLPVKYFPLTNLSAADRVYAKDITDQQNLLLEYSMEVDDRIAKLREDQWFDNKYGNQLYSMGWKVVKRTANERVVVARDKDGKPTKFARKEITRTEAHPEYTRWAIEDAWFDGLIDDMQAQPCIVVRSRPTYQTLIDKQAAGEWINVDTVTNEHLYNASSDIMQDRHDNAEDGADGTTRTGAFANFTSWLKAPINDDGKWDEDGTPEAWHWVELIGNLDGDAVVCVRLTANPYPNKENPFQLVHSHRDDNGAFHMGYATIVRPAYQEYKTTTDQWFDAKNWMNNAPWKVGQGALHNSDHTFGPHREFIMRPGKFDQIERLNVEINTQDMQAFISYLEQRIHDVMASTTAFRGEAMGSRTSASEARNALDQSLKPAMEKLDYQADQKLKWMARWDAMLWREFSNKDTVISLTRGATTVEIKPAELYGPLRVRILAVDDYVRNTLAELEQDRFLATIMPIAAPDMGKRGRIATYKHVFRPRGFPVDDMFPMTSEFDAKHVALSENQGFMSGIEDIPKAEEDHDTHGIHHKAFMAQLKATSNRTPELARALELVTQHDLGHDQLKESNEQAVMQGATQASAAGGLGGPDSVPATSGQEAQETLGAEGGGGV